MRTRPRRSHHRPLQRYLETGSLPLQEHFPPTIAAAVQSCPGGVWTPELVRDQAVARLHESAFRGVSVLCCVCLCVWACVCVCVCVCVFVVFLPWAFVALSVFLRCLCCCGGPFGAWLLVFVSSGSCSGRFSGPVSCSRPRLVRSSFGSPPSLRAQQISRAKVSRTHFPR